MLSGVLDTAKPIFNVEYLGEYEYVSEWAKLHILSLAQRKSSIQVLTQKKFSRETVPLISIRTY